MEQPKIAQLVSENMKTIFAFSMSRLNNRQDAEDLSSEIIMQILKSSKNLKDDKAFYGFIWSIAKNVYKRYLRNNKKSCVELDDGYMGNIWITPEDDYLDKEELYILRRELSLLSEQYRNVTVLYYCQNKSCSEISQELAISVDMVKYYLFKARKILKEGISMTRELGEKSYNPSVFKMDYWGNGPNEVFWKLFERKLPGNILLAAYYNPVTISELSVELGVSSIYLEDEIEILLKHEMLKTLANGKYQTNIIIFTDVYEKEVLSKIKEIYEDTADKVNCAISDVADKSREIKFQGCDYNQNRLLWTLANLSMFYAMNLADGKARKIFGDYPLLSNGSFGFVYGYDNNYVNHHFNGIYGRCENKENTVYVSVINYRIIEKCQQWQPNNWDKSVKAMTAAVLGGSMDNENEMLINLIEDGFINSKNDKLTTNFPVFTSTQFNEMWDLLKPISEEIEKCISEIVKIAGAILRSHAPKVLEKQCDQLASIKFEMDVVALIIETMVRKGYLKIPEVNEKLAIYGVVI